MRELEGLVKGVDELNYLKSQETGRDLPTRIVCSLLFLIHTHPMLTRVLDQSR